MLGVATVADEGVDKLGRAVALLGVAVLALEDVDVETTVCEAVINYRGSC